MKQRKMEFSGVVEKRVTMGYLLHLPKGYDEDAEKRWPLILFLRGIGERGDDPEKLKIHGIPRVVEERDDLPFITVSPQCPIYSYWSAEVDSLRVLLKDVRERYRVDTSRIYVTGLSMGGFGTWHLILEYPRIFAAALPICGGLQHMGILPVDKLSALKDLPIWVFHGAKDNVIPYQKSEELVEYLRSIGGNVRFTLYPEADHDSWTVTYNNPEIYSWMLRHRNPDFKI